MHSARVKETCSCSFDMCGVAAMLVLVDNMNAFCD